MEDSLCNLRVMLESYSTGEMRTLFFLFSKESGGSARRPAEMATADLLKDSKPPLTLRPNFNCEKGSVTADKPPVHLSIFVDGNLRGFPCCP